MPPGKWAPYYRWQTRSALRREPSPSLLREFAHPINRRPKKRLPDSAEPWASKLCQANPSHSLLKKHPQQFHFYFAHDAGPERIPAQKFFGAQEERIRLPFFA
jgi:hypothetical protein